MNDIFFFTHYAKEIYLTAFTATIIANLVLMFPKEQNSLSFSKDQIEEIEIINQEIDKNVGLTDEEKNVERGLIWLRTYSMLIYVLPIIIVFLENNL